MGDSLFNQQFIQKAPEFINKGHRIIEIFQKSKVIFLCTIFPFLIHFNFFKKGDLCSLDFVQLGVVSVEPENFGHELKTSNGYYSNVVPLCSYAFAQINYKKLRKLTVPPFHEQLWLFPFPAGKEKKIIIKSGVIFDPVLALVTDRVPENWVSGFGSAVDNWV